MDKPEHPPRNAPPPLLSQAEINALMRQPVRSRPAVTVIGDDNVASFTPAPPAAPIRRA